MDTSSQKLDPIANSLELTPLTQVTPVKSDTVTDDFEYARANLIATIDKGQEALSDMLDVAARSQHPRGYEVVATLVKTISDANKDLLELSKRRKELMKDEVSKPSTVNNNLFLGSTADLLKLLKDNK